MAMRAIKNRDGTITVYADERYSSADALSAAMPLLPALGRHDRYQVEQEYPGERIVRVIHECRTDVDVASATGVVLVHA